MKKQDNNPIDQFFKENTEQHFPYDPTMWKGAEKGLSFLFMKKRILIFSFLFVFFISSVAVFILFKTDTKAGKISITKNSENPDLVEKNSTNKSILSYGKKNENDAKPLTDNETKLVNNSSASLQKKDEKSAIVINKESDSKKEFEINADEKPQVKIEITPPIEPIVLTKESDAISPVSEIKKFMEIALLSKSLHSFPYANFNKNPELNPKIKDPEKRKFATTIEFENRYSILLKQQLNGLPKEQLEFKNQYEKPQNSNGYLINVMLQRGGIGLITGVGYSTASVKTNYFTDTNHFHFIKTTLTKYRMIRDSIPYQGGYYSYILEYQDTIYKRSEQLKGEVNQVEFQWIQIPLKISFQYSLNRLRFSVRAGADFMWLYNLKGTFINSGLSGLNEVEKLKKFNVNTSGQLMAGYQLNHKFQVGGSFNFNQQLGSNFANYYSRFQSKGFGWYIRYSL